MRLRGSRLHHLRLVKGCLGSGQTGAGKTYTIIGNCPENNSDFDHYRSSLCGGQRGILPRSLELIFEEQKRKRNSRVTISFYEIYNEKIFDLLVSTMKPLEIRESKNGEISIPGLAAIEVLSVKEVTNYLAEGIKVRMGGGRTG
jgi:kinesin family protein 4/21/27